MALHWYSLKVISFIMVKFLTLLNDNMQIFGYLFDVDSI